MATRTTVAQLEAVVTNLANTAVLHDDAILALKAQLDRIERQLAMLQLAEKPTHDVPTYDPCKYMSNAEFRLAYAQYRGVTGNAPTADAVRAWVRAGRPGL